MLAHRFYGEGEIRSVPRPEVPALSCAGFVVCPLPVMMWFGPPTDWAQDVYRLAYQQAREQVSPPWHQRSLLASAN